MLDHQTPPAQVMLQLITGFWVSQAAGTVAELGIADQLADGPKSAAEIAHAVGAEPRAIHRLLRACAMVGLFAQDGERYSLTPVGGTLRSDVAGSMRGMAIAQTAPGHWLPWGQLREAVRTGKRQTMATLGREIFEHYAANPQEGGAFMSAMEGLSALVAEELVRVVDFRGVSKVVDIGGAHGTLIRSLLAAHPALRGTLLDLPHVAAGARDAIGKASLASRCEVLAGDFFASVPEADLYVLKQILHDWDDEQAVTILRNCATALRPSGRVLVVEMVIPDDNRPTPAQLMDLNMLVMLPGRERTVSEYAGLLSKAGLALQRVYETHSPFQIIEATR